MNTLKTLNTLNSLKTLNTLKIYIMTVDMGKMPMTLIQGFQDNPDRYLWFSGYFRQVFRVFRVFQTSSEVSSIDTIPTTHERNAHMFCVSMLTCLLTCLLRTRLVTYVTPCTPLFHRCSHLIGISNN